MKPLCSREWMPLPPLNLRQQGKSDVPCTSPQDCELRSACSQGNASLAGQLLARGAAVNSADVRSGHSALHCAAQHGSVAVVHLLLDNGAQVSKRTLAQRSRKRDALSL